VAEAAEGMGLNSAEASSRGHEGSNAVRKAEFQEVSDSKDDDKAVNLDLLLDVVVPVTVELGRTSLTVKDILSTYQGSVIELDRTAGEPVYIMVGGKPLAKGEVVVVKERFGVRVTELIGSIEGISKT
jgi:flagellar motor switch protein FliN/FliY